VIKIIAHRGFWVEPSEQNTLVAFERALQNGFGIETDFRDFNGKLVISHDPADANSIDAQAFFDLCRQYPDTDPHAINVKSDGLQNLLFAHPLLWDQSRYFVFDMSVPDSLGYLRKGMNTFTRVSEYESYQDFDGRAKGIWLDSFGKEWYCTDDIKRYLAQGKSVAIVSSELHGRDHLNLWKMLKPLYTEGMSLMLCTDLPLEAKKYFS
jgi:glycerophosphoryl diester phosphodiesterase